MTVLAAIAISPEKFLAIVGAAAIAGGIAAVVKFGDVVIPVVVLELVAGVVIGPNVLGLHVTPFISFFSSIGLGMLFFFAGYEIDLRRISGAPMRLALLGWAVSLAIAYTVGGVLAAAGVVLSLLYTGSALATTAIGTLIPILSDNGLLEGSLGTYLLAAGAVGEFGPVVLVTLVLSAQDTLHNALILLAFMAVVVAVGVLTLRSSRITLPLLERTLESSSQLAIRWVLVLVFALALLAYQLGLELLLGGFAAGVIVRRLLADHELPAFDSKLSAIAFGVFVPFFFVVSGMKLDVSALFDSAGGVAKLVLFLALFLVVRGVPALLLYRSVLDGRKRAALAFFSSTQLPLVVAITSLATADGHMRPSTAAALVGAAAISTLVFPILGLRSATREPVSVAEVASLQAGESTAAGA
ncbi:MAG TPA: cation:proton antiporter [Solirubrobacteraceae bacterium]|nr:cation:proton antiporter [Solirubrobacteraceae bacterium]